MASTASRASRPLAQSRLLSTARPAPEASLLDLVVGRGDLASATQASALPLRVDIGEWHQRLQVALQHELSCLLVCLLSGPARVLLLWRYVEGIAMFIEAPQVHGAETLARMLPFAVSQGAGALWLRRRDVLGISVLLPPLVVLAA